MKRPAKPAYFLLSFSFFLLTNSHFIVAQNSYPIGFQRNQNISVINDDTLHLAWTGGMNSLAFFAFDLDLDGNNDLIAFEKNGNRLLPFIQHHHQWQYHPEYSHQFPDLHDWAIFKDYDNDGKKDIFTYGLAGIRVFHNISQQYLDFELVNEQLQSFYYTDYSNIYASPDDYLVVDDIDNDGDLDILNFWVLGKFVHFQRNYAVENHFANGFLDFRLEDECWGKFSEGSDNNEITLLSYCEEKDNQPTRHVGSTMCLTDFNQDGLKDLILGDIDFPQVILLTNGGTPTDALMVAQTANFPTASNPISLFSMPLVSEVDVDNDGQNELIVSPADPSLTKSQNINSVWLYNYDESFQNYTLQTQSFLQDEMIDVGSGAYPVLFDWNNDGLLDLFVGNYGYYDSSAYINGFLNSYYSAAIAYFENVGTADFPAFQLINSDFMNLRHLNLQALYPSFGDLDQDGQVEIICGLSNGTLLFIKDNQLIDNYLNIDVGDFATPQLFDIDLDGKLDLLIGNRRGQIAYYQNVSTNNQINFNLEDPILGNVDVRNFTLSYFGYATPCFFRQNEETKLICGNEQGNLFFYDNIDDNLNGDFHLVTDKLAENINNTAKIIKEGGRIGVTIGRLNNDEFPEMIVGNYAGGLSFFDGTPALPISIINAEKDSINIYPNPAENEVTIELGNNAHADIYIYDVNGKLLQNISSFSKINKLNISNFKSSIFLINIVTDKKSSWHKLIKK